MKTMETYSLLLLFCLVLLPASVRANYTDGASGPAVYEASKGSLGKTSKAFQPTGHSKSYPGKDRYGVLSGGNPHPDVRATMPPAHLEELPFLAADQCPMTEQREQARTRSRLIRERDFTGILEAPTMLTLIHKARSWKTPQEGRGPIRLLGIQADAKGDLVAEVVLGRNFVCAGQRLFLRVDDRPDPSIQVLWMNRTTVLFLTESGHLFTLNDGAAPSASWRMVWDADLFVDYFNPLKDLAKDLKQTAKSRAKNRAKKSIKSKQRAKPTMKPPFLPK